VLPNLLKALPKSERKRLTKLTELESQARAKGFTSIAGVDEAGRGPLAGPVVAAACMIPEGLFFAGINDSKLLCPKKRKDLFFQLTSHEDILFAVGYVDHAEIDQMNIYRATLKAMQMAIGQLKIKPDYILVDGVKLPVEEGQHAERVIQGDRLSQMIAAASIIAKETRDAYMRQMHERYPEYGFDEHKGYATVKHCAALAKFGPSPVHRRTFKSVMASGEGPGNLIDFPK
jgi:ribonuclease HII